MSCFAIEIDQPVPYEKGLMLQERIHQLRRCERIPDTVLFLEHEPVVTLGNRGRVEALRLQPEEFRQRGIDLVHASRGGDVTFHGPGQVVMYPILRLGGVEADAHGYLHNLEEVAIRTSMDWGVHAWRREGKNGAWTELGKIAAIGFRIRRWITLHGMSFNVDLDLSGFQTIVPCGLVGEAVTRLADVSSWAVDLEEVRERMAFHFSAVLGRPLERLHLADADAVFRWLPPGGEAS